ncbi:signal recognition particle 68 kDa protein [Teratosphaeria destructans]|uniref:Signal recognition particle subunit SRP68 n=1 Tax=Teratosphaeria destructans TaxID=418781 RepID=A0A9W7SPS3_9PEZI|nr:signal recognition particle 68 kDa protein [Teratosphaeria destructans]
MDITAFVSARRETLLIGDYATYRAQLSRQLHSLRKRLGLATPKREKFAKKDVTAENIGSNHEYGRLLILTSERAWAHAMHIKTSHSDDAGGITGSTRAHIISRLHKAVKVAAELVASLTRQDTSHASDQDVLEARAYRASLAGAEEFEKQAGGQKGGEEGKERWRGCLRAYAEARVVYASLYERGKKEVFKEVLATAVDPTIRYAAYQAGLARTVGIPAVARRYFPVEDQELVRRVEAVDAWALKEKPAPKTEAEKEARPMEVPNSVTWRGRRANIVDASIGQALAGVTAAEARLRSYLSSNPTASSRDKAAAYDDILVAAQDAADASKRATDELEKERVDEGDPRMQDLRVTSLSVSYDMISWRIGRNRVLIGEDDGLALPSPHQQKRSRKRKDGSEYPEKEEPRGRRLARLRERNVLFDATVRDILSIKELRGAMRDATFVEELDGKIAYFRALKCVNIAYSHILLGNHLNALALLSRAQDLASTVRPSTSRTAEDSAPPSLDILPASAEELQKHTTALLRRTHARVEMQKLESNSRLAAEKDMVSAAPAVENLMAYPSPGRAWTAGTWWRIRRRSSPCRSSRCFWTWHGITLGIRGEGRARASKVGMEMCGCRMRVWVGVGRRRWRSGGGGLGLGGRVCCWMWCLQCIGLA